MDQFKVSKAPPTVYYIREFVSSEEEEYLIGRVENAPKPKWEQLSHRRLQNWGGILGKKGLIVDSELPNWLQVYIDKVCQSAPGSLFPQDRRPNHVLVNEYLPGQGIMPHTDGPAYHPVVATISLGGHIVLDFYPRSQSESSEGESVDQAMENENGVVSGRTVAGSLLLERRSLVVITASLYSDHLHGIVERTNDHLSEQVWNLDMCTDRSVGDIVEREKRLSLTIRNIPKVLNLTKWRK